MAQRVVRLIGSNDHVERTLLSLQEPICVRSYASAAVSTMLRGRGRQVEQKHRSSRNAAWTGVAQEASWRPGPAPILNDLCHGQYISRQTHRHMPYFFTGFSWLMRDKVDGSLLRV